MKTYLLLLTLLFISITSCKDKEPQVPDITGTWQFAGFNTANNALNKLLENVILPGSGFNPGDIHFVFDADKKLSVILPEDITTPIVIASYAYDNEQLALRFDKFPIPFNAFFIQKLTNSEIILNNTIPGEIIKIIWDIIKDNKPELAPLLEGILAQSTKDGLKVTIILSKSTLGQSN